MAKLTIDLSGRQGLAPKFNGDVDRTQSDPQNRYLGREGQLAEGIFNPYRRYGYISPSNTVFTNLTFTGGTHDAQIGSTIFDRSNNDAYFAERGQQIFQIDGLDDTELQVVHDLGSTGTPVIYDLEIYQLNGSPRLFYLYEKSGNMEIGEAVLPCSSENDDWLTADVSGNFTNSLTNEAFMRVADNGFMYVFQDNVVHKIDGTTDGGSTGTAEANVLVFPSTFQITDAIDYRGKMYIALRQDTAASWGHTVATENSACGVYVWDRSSTVVNSVDFITINGAKDLRNLFVSPSGNLRLMAANSENIGEIRQYNGVTFVPIIELGLKSYPQNWDAIAMISNSSIWLASDGGIYTYGSVYPGEAESIFQIGTTGATMGTSSRGCILFGGANNGSTSGGFKETRNALYLFYLDNGASYYAKTWDIHGTGADSVTATADAGNVYSLVKLLPSMSTVRYIDLYMLPGSGSGDTAVGTVKVYFNQSSTAFKSETITRDHSATGYHRIELNKPYVTSIQIEIEFATGVTLGTLDFAPSAAVVDYEPTNTKG